jgi:hypothetical protein
MAKFNPKEVEEINAIIANIEKKLKPGMEIGGRDKGVLTPLLKSQKIDKKPISFACRREHSDAIVAHFVNEKKIARSRFSIALQNSVFLV